MQFLKKYFAEFTGLGILIIYMFTIAPSVIQIDSGELAAVIGTLGIAHPTGYPLFTIAGYLFLLIPLPFTEIFRTNLLAAIWCAAGIVFFVKSVKLIFDNLPAKKEVKPKGKKSKKAEAAIAKVVELPELTKLIVSVLSGLFLAFSTTYWFQSTSIEVYSLHLLLINSVIYLLLKAYFFDEKNKTNKHWFALSVLLALSFSNHMTTLLILPGIAFLFFSKEKFTKAAFTTLGKMLAIFFPILILIYSYLPIRASFSPLLNWGNPVNWENLIRHISGKQYQVWLFSSTDAAKKQLEYFFSNYANEFTIIGVLLIAAGLLIGFRSFKRISFFILISFASTVLYSINYDIVDIDSYFLLAYIASAMFASFAFYQIIIFLKKKNMQENISAVFLSILIAVIYFMNSGKVDQSKNYIYEDYTKSLLNSVDENAIILSYQWDYFLSASYYFQFVENYRRDVAVIDKELLRRSWYFNQLETCYPGILNGIEKDVNTFIEAVKPFERSENFNPQLLEAAYRRIMTGLVTENIGEHTIYIAPEMIENEMQRGEFQLPPGYYLIPELFLYRVSKSLEYQEARKPDFEFRELNVENHYTNFIKNITATMLTNRAIYEMNFKKTERAKVYVNKIRDVFPDYKLPAQLKGLK
ncbi:MAG: DUF2723 domain-containing protein [Ignavibacteriae bacterium]|nr:DUF2723 domain-containing protein [Ignavibacteriota bacterium]